MEMNGLLKSLTVIIAAWTQVVRIHASAPCTTDTWGREFYLAVFKPESSGVGGYSGQVEYTLFAHSKGGGSITISAPGANYNRRSYLSKGVRSFVLPHSIQTSASSGVNNTGITVTTTNDITLTAFVRAGNFHAAALVLPKTVLSTEYIVPYGKHDILVVSLQNSTRFDATRYYVSSQQLNKHEVYHLSGRSSSSSESTVITSNHPIAVFMIIIASNSGGYYEQMIPTKSWGYRYIVPNFYQDRHFSFQATASQHDTYINTYYRTHPGTMYLTTGRMIGATFDLDPYVLTSSKPIMVMQYGTEGSFVTNVPAISQFSNSYSVYVPTEVRDFYNNIVIITTEQDEGGITFDATYIPARQRTETVMVDNIKYVVVTYRVAAGELRIFHTSPGGRFGGFMYGHKYVSSHYESYYALPLGLTLKEEGCVPPSTTTLTVPTSITTSSHTNDTICFACQDMSSLIFCDHIQTCNTGEKCFVEKHLISGGETKYSSGCSSNNMCQTSSSNNSCRQCCTGSCCNNMGCGDTSTPSRDHRGPFCYDCDHVGMVEDCHRVTLCKSGQVCIIKKYSWGDTLSHFSLGCADKSCVSSGSSVPFGRKRSTPTCERCCQDDFCNKYCINAPAVIVFGRAIHSLSKIGEELYIEPLDHGLALRTVSSSRSAYACFLFAPSFFQHYDDGSGDIDTQDSDDSLRCKIAMKSILTVFKSLSTMEKTVERCKIKLDMADARLVFQLHCRHGIVKTHNLAFIECETLQAVFSKDMCPNSLTASAKLLIDAVLNFQNNQEEVTLIVNPEKIVLKNYVDDEPDPTKVMHTNLRLDPDEFDNCQIGVDTEVTFCLKELRAILAFVEVTTQPLTLHFETGGRPIVFSVDSDSSFEANFVLATLADQSTQSQVPSQAKVTQKRTQNKASSRLTQNRTNVSKTQASGDNREKTDRHNARTRDSDRERSELLDAAYEEMMNDDDFDDMVIENQTTMHVNKTPVSSAYTKTRTDLGSKSSTVDNESNRNISDIVNRGIERIIGQGGDNSRRAGDSRTSRVESPVPGTSKDDSQSPVIPILQQGTKTPKMVIQDLEDDDDDEIPGTPPAKRFRSLFFGLSQASTQSQTQQTTSAKLSTSRVLAEDTDEDD